MEKEKKKTAPLEITRGKMVALMLLIVAGGAYFLFGKTPAGTRALDIFTETDTGLSFNYEDKTDVYSYGGKGYFLTTKDGMNFYTIENEIKWTYIYPVSLKEPIMAGNGQYVGVCDAGGQTFFLFSGDGLLYSMNYDDKILSFSVSSGGYAALICKSGGDYKIQAVNIKGMEINYYYCRSENIFPVAARVSSDGRILAISVVDVNPTVMESKLMLLYNNANEKQMWINGIFYQITAENELIAGLEFLSENELVYLTERNLVCINTDADNNSALRQKWALALKNEIDSLAVSSGRTIAIAYGKPLPGEDARTENTIEFYNANLKKIGEYELPGRASLYTYGDYIVAGSMRKFAAFNSNGKLLWEYFATSDVKKLAVFDNRNTALLLENLRALVIKKH